MTGGIKKRLVPRGGMKRPAWSSLIILLAAYAFLAGCSVPVSTAPAKKVATKPVSDTGKVMRFEDGREGFVLSEKVKIPTDLRRYFDEAVALMAQEEYEKAIELLEKVVKASPGVTAPYVNMALACRKVGKPEVAEEYLKTALKIFPGHPLASNEYGLLLRKTGRFGEARQVYEKSLAEFPEYFPLRKNFGILCDLYLNDPQCALTQYELYSQANPRDEQIGLWISELRLRTEKRP
jgi:tetratricopeptide (TPR) repeat protein